MRRNMMALLIGCGLIVTGAYAQEDGADPEITSNYTELDLDNECVAYDTDEMGGSFSCPGYAGYSVLFSEGDLRQSVFYGYVGEWFAEGAFESFSGFNNVSGKIEWRLKAGLPFATIHRWFIEPEDGSTDADDKGEVLVVSKVAQPGVGDGCVAGYVDARENDDANELARQVADELAPGFMCRIDEPVFHGKEGLAAGFPVRTFGP